MCDYNDCKVRGSYGNGIWWLRSPGSFQDRAEHVGSRGDVFDDGYPVPYNDCAVRPALYINL